MERNARRLTPCALPIHRSRKRGAACGRLIARRRSSNRGRCLAVQNVYNVFNDGFGPSDQYVREFLTTPAPRMPPAAFRASRFQSHPSHTHHLSSLLLVELVFTNCPFTRGLASASCFLEAYLIFLL